MAPSKVSAHGAFSSRSGFPTQKWLMVAHTMVRRWSKANERNVDGNEQTQPWPKMNERNVACFEWTIHYQGWRSPSHVPRPCPFILARITPLKAPTAFDKGRSGEFSIGLQRLPESDGSSNLKETALDLLGGPRGNIV
jgi:hypothetical protein